MKDHGGLVLDVTASDATLDKDFLERLGHPVLVCHGPAWGCACPIIAGDCPMVDAAHGVIFQLDLDRPQHRVILSRYKEVLKDDVPIMVVVTREQEARFHELLIGVQVWYGPPTIARLDGFAAQTEAADDLRA